MKRLLLLLCFGSIVLAQSLDLTVSPAVVAPGGIVTVTVNFTDSATPSGVSCVAAVLPPGVSGSPAPGSSATATQKGVYFANSNGRTIVCGADQSNLPLNDTSLTSGPLFTFALTAPGSSGQTVSVGLMNLDGASTTGGAVALASSGTSFKTRSKYDLNADGVVDQLDVDAARSPVLGLQPCTTADVTGDGQCKTQDLQLVIKAAQGKIGG